MKSKTLILTFIIAITSLETVLSQSISFRLKHKNQTEIKFGSGISPNGSLSSTKDTSTAGCEDILFSVMKTDSNCKKLKQSCSKLKKKKKCSKPLKDSIGSSKTAKKCKKALKGNMDGKVGSFCLQTCDLCDTDYCSPNPCKNGGECKSIVKSFNCVCTNGYSGTDCNIPDNDSCKDVLSKKQCNRSKSQGMCEEKLKWASKKCRKTCDLCDPNKLVSTETSTVTRETTILSTENTIVTDPPLNMTTVDSDCQQKDYFCDGRRIDLNGYTTDRGVSLANWELCGRICQSTSKCNKWHYWLHNKACYMYEDCTFTISEGNIAGPKHCPTGIEVDVEYEAKADGPGCADGRVVKIENCKSAAEKLGFTGIFEIGNWNHAPPGCFVGHPSDNWAYVYFNDIATGGSVGKSEYKSICKKKEGECGVHRPDKIVGGSPVSPYSIPWQVGLVRPWPQTRTCCGGTLISVRHVLSAAHCVAPHKCRWNEVIVGEHDLLDGEDGIRHEYSKYIFHPKFGTLDGSGAANYDFLVIILKEPVVLGPRVSLACLAEPSMEGDALAGKAAVVSGWGRQCSGCPTTDVLHSASVPVVKSNKCQKAYSPWPITDAMLCAGYIKKGEIDSCQGDSGGPLTYTTGEKVYLIGVVSWGSGCAVPGRPGVYGRVTKVRDWIEDHMYTPGPNYESMEKFHVLDPEGKGTGDFYSVSLSFCMEKCAEAENCRSFAYCSRTDGQDIPEDDGRCHLKEMKGSKTQAIKESIDCTSYYERDFRDDEIACVISTFKETGCLTPKVGDSQIVWWKFQTDSKSFYDMLVQCEMVLAGIASEVEERKCCGSKGCAVSSCTLQTSWKDGPSDILPYVNDEIKSCRNLNPTCSKLKAKCSITLNQAIGNSKMAKKCKKDLKDRGKENVDKFCERACLIEAGLT